MKAQLAVIAALAAAAVSACSGSNGGASDAAAEKFTLGAPSLTIPDAAPDGSWAVNGWESVLLLPDGGFAVAASTAIHQFSAGGDHVATVGRKGDGPGEFSRIGGYADCPGGGFSVADWIAARLTMLYPAPHPAFVTDYRGHEVSQGLDPVECDGSRLIFIEHSADFGPRPPRDVLRRDTALVLRGDSALGVFDTVARVPAGYSFSGLQQPFGPNGIFAVSPGILAYGSGDDSVVYIRAPFTDGTPVRIVLPGLPVAQVTAEMRRDRVAQSERNTPPGLWNRTLKTLFDRVPWPKTLPLWDKLVVDDSGRVWVREYRSPLRADSVPDRWHVVDRHGEWIATLTLPDSIRFVGVRANDAVVIERADDGTEALQVRKIVR